MRDGVFVDLGEAFAGAKETIDAAGGLVTSALVEPHIHLDAVLTVGQPRYNQTGSLFEGIAIWGDRVKDLTVEDVKQRVRTVLRPDCCHFAAHRPALSPCRSAGTNLPSLRSNCPSNQTSPPPKGGVWISTRSQCTTLRLPLSHSS